MERFTVGTNGECAENHAICDGPVVVGIVYGAGYPAGKGYSSQTEAMTRFIVAAMNEKLERDGTLNKDFDKS